MSKVFVTEASLTAIGAAIRRKNGSTDTYLPSEMAAAIDAIEDPSVLTTKAITANGNYDAAADEVDGYSLVTVNVPNSFTSEDEGKVVSSGALVAQTSLSVTENGTVDTTLNDEVVVNVPAANLGTKTITQNGTYSAEDDSLDGYSEVTVNVSGGGGGGTPTISRADWNALTTAQKQAYGLVGIIDYTTGFNRGVLVNGADFSTIIPAEMGPIYSWNASNNSTHSYTFSGTTLANNNTEYCMAIMSQNGGSPSWTSSLGTLREGSTGNGSYAVTYGSYSNGASASTYSTGDNWNNSEIVCFEFSADVSPEVKELFYEQAQSGTYTYTYTADASENLLLVCMRGGNSGGSYTVTGLALKSNVTSSGARFNNVYFDSVEAGDEISVSIPYSNGANNNGSLLVVLLSVG